MVKGILSHLLTFPNSESPIARPPINADVANDEELTIGLRRSTPAAPSGQPIPSFTLSEFIPLVGDFLNVSASWRVAGRQCRDLSAALAAAAGDGLQLEFAIRGPARLYSFAPLPAP